MRKNIVKSIVALLVVFGLNACQDDGIPMFDTTNGRAIAGFNGNNATPKIIFNPSADTENIITVGVSTKSSSDRTVQLSIVDSITTLDPSFYKISTLTPVIKAGDFTTDIIVTTISGSTLPGSSDVIGLSLNSVEGAEILSESEADLLIGLSVKCPSTDIASIPGTYKIITDDFGTSVGDDQFEMIAGPGDNQVTMVNPFDQPNPDAGGEQNYMVTIDIDPETGVAKVSKQAAWHYSNFAASPDYGEGRVEGGGLALTCIGQIQLTLENTVDAGSFGSYELIVEKQ